MIKNIFKKVFEALNHEYKMRLFEFHNIQKKHFIVFWNNCKG